VNACTVAVDLGGTHVRAALVGADGAVLVRIRCDTPRDEPTPAVIPRLIKDVIGMAHDVAPARRPESEQLGEDGGFVMPTRAVVGVPGVVDHGTERLVVAPNLPPSWISKLNETWLQAETGLSVAMANDADLAAVGEANFGAGTAEQDVVYVTISTGVGAGLVVGERLVRGTLSGGEIGHTVIDRVAAADGRPCTVEDLGSGTAIERAAVAAGIQAKGAALADLVRAGDPTATAIWTEAIAAVGIGIANLAWIVGPQVVILGGGVGMNHDLVVPTIARQLQRFGPPDGSPIRVVTAQLGDDAALAGSAAWWTAVGRDR
jgi:glucokinase